ncbi:MAG: rhomboid family intramembrane serine protease [Candidatus Omnitrophica bacterium]|nr:rhomboid family intramembrane serine protease [Candidatus Omnitrophota bacterium]
MCCCIPPIPIASEDQLHEKPKITYILLAVETSVLLFNNILTALNGLEIVPGNLNEWIFQHLGYIPNERYPWTFFTYSLLHDGWFHLLGNLLFLWIFGSFLEQRLGPRRYLFLIILGSVFSCVGHDLAINTLGTGQTITIPLVGASGFISAILGAFVVLLPTAKFRCFYFILFDWGIVKLPAIVYIPIFVFWGDLFALAYHGADTAVAHGAHLGGAFWGILFGIFIRYTPKTQKAVDREVQKQDEEGKALARLAHENFRQALDMKATDAALSLIREGEKLGRPLPLTLADRVRLAMLLEENGETFLAAQTYRSLMAGDLNHDQRLEIGLRLAKILLVYERNLEATKTLLRTLYKEYQTDPRLPEIQKLVDQVKETERNLFKRPR